MRQLLLTLFTTILLLTACSTPTFKTQNGYPTIEVAQIFDELPASPLAVGFDVDDTVLFSSPAFYYVAYNRDGEHGSNRYGAKPFDSRQAWIDINNEFDKFSLPKKIAFQLLEKHQSRGDTIYFITAREPSKQEQLSALLQRTFNLKEMYPVIFVGSHSKAEPIRKLNITLYYGDSDSDIREALDAGARAIRILRAGNSTDPRKLNLGGFGESVLTGSDI